MPGDDAVLQPDGSAQGDGLIGSPDSQKRLGDAVDPSTASSRRAPARSRRARWVAAVVVIALLVGAGVALALRPRGRSAAAVTTPDVTASTVPARYAKAADCYERLRGPIGDLTVAMIDGNGDQVFRELAAEFGTQNPEFNVILTEARREQARSFQVGLNQAAREEQDLLSAACDRLYPPDS